MNKELLQKNIISLLGLEALSQEKKIQLLEKITDLVFKRTMVKVMGELSEEDQAELEKLIDTGDSDKTNNFVAEKVPNFEELMNKEILAVKEEMMTEAEKME